MAEAIYEFSLKGKKVQKLILALLLLFGLFPTVASAQQGQSATATWGNSLTWRSVGDRSVDLSRSEAQQRARNGGYGPGQVITTYNGDVTNNTEQTFNGPVSNSSSTNAVNLTTNSTSVDNRDGTVGVTFTTGNASYQATQTAQSSNTSSGAGGISSTGSSANTGATTGPNGNASTGANTAANTGGGY